MLSEIVHRPPSGFLADSAAHAERVVALLAPSSRRERGGLTRGMPTAHAAPPLRDQLAASDAPAPVWPDPEGTVRGEEFAPLYRSVPQAARADERLYELLALVDALRGGRARERELAVKELRTRLA